MYFIAHPIKFQFLSAFFKLLRSIKYIKIILPSSVSVSTDFIWAEKSKPDLTRRIPTEQAWSNAAFKYFFFKKVPIKIINRDCTHFQNVEILLRYIQFFDPVRFKPNEKHIWRKFPQTRQRQARFSPFFETVILRDGVESLKVYENLANVHHNQYFSKNKLIHLGKCS